MEKLILEVKNAAANLKVVAQGLRVPLDTSTLDKALDALLKATKSETARPAEVKVTDSK